MPYVIPPMDAPRTLYYRSWLNLTPRKMPVWDGTPETVMSSLTFYDTGDYVVPAVHKSNSRADIDNNGGPVSEKRILAAHRTYKLLERVYADMGVTGPIDREDAIIFGPSNKYSRLASLRLNNNLSPVHEVMSFHLLTNTASALTRAYREPSEETPEPTVDKVIKSMQKLYNSFEDLLREHGGEPSPESVRKLIGFAASSKFTSLKWMQNKMYTESVVRFISEGVPLSFIVFFHGVAPLGYDTPSRPLGTPIPKPVPLDVTEIRQLRTLPADLMVKLYSDTVLFP